MGDPVREIRSDTLSGASELIERGARVLADHAEGSRSRTAKAFVGSLAKVGLMVADAQPAMAPFIHLADAALKAAEGAKDLAGARVAATAAIEGFVRASAEDRERTARTAARLIRRDSVVLVYSRSSTVETALLAAAREGRRFTVLCPEARPAMEGRVLARKLAEAGIPVIAFVDAAAFSVFPTADLVLIRADALVPVGLINKVGTSGLALLASGSGVPVHCVAGRHKLLPSASLIDPHREGEHLADVWGECPKGVRVMDRYYDLTQLDAVKGFAVGDSILSTSDLRSRLRSIRLHPLLRRDGRGARRK
jgi:translation initiation factor 2B subunit (eIF-2B alpha/beta/delta family)